MVFLMLPQDFSLVYKCCLIHTFYYISVLYCDYTASGRLVFLFFLFLNLLFKNFYNYRDNNDFALKLNFPTLSLDCLGTMFRAFTKICFRKLKKCFVLDLILLKCVHFKKYEK